MQNLQKSKTCKNAKLAKMQNLENGKTCMPTESLITSYKLTMINLPKKLLEIKMGTYRQTYRQTYGQTK